MKAAIVLLITLGSFMALPAYAELPPSQRQIIDFNFDWRFHLGDVEGAFLADDIKGKDAWRKVRIPHDWSAHLPYTQKNTASSTGFKAGGIGWYRKRFSLENEDLKRALWLEFDGIYNNSQVWINGRFAAERPSGYSSFAVEVSDYAIEGENLVAIKVNRTAYNDARWYTGSGIYRDVRLVKTNANHIAHWGVKIAATDITKQEAKVSVDVDITHSVMDKRKRLYLDVRLIDQRGNTVSTSSKKIALSNGQSVRQELALKQPGLWSLANPNLYTAEVVLRNKKQILDSTRHTFGVRSIDFDANKGFLLNGEQTKIKGVNLHHDAGAVGAAVPKSIWRYRLKKLQSVGVNALRLAHNPHSPELLDLADEMGFLVIAEAFDDWMRPKDKSIVFLSDNAGKGESVASYTEHFTQWAERDLSDLIRRDYNHPSIIMWSIGNEIEWTYPYYAASQIWDDEEKEYHGSNPPVYDAKRVLANFEKNKGAGEDNLVRTAHYLAKIVKEHDQSRPVTAGLVTPSVDFASGYTEALDVVGFNYRSQEYDIAHKTYPNTPIYGAENWGSWPEWQAALEREFVPGIFIWTGFAYKGEAGPWPRKGLEISLFDYAGNKTPRGHQFESFWVNKPKVYLATIDANKAEYQYSQDAGWHYVERKKAIPKMQWLRAWEWYGVESTWNYKSGQKVLVHVYANTEQSELFLNGRSLGKQRLSDDNNRILFWHVPFEAGELKVVGYNGGLKKAEYRLKTYGQLSHIELTVDKKVLSADQYDVAHVHARLVDKHGNSVLLPRHKVRFELSGPARLLAVDNGWESSVEEEYSNNITTHNGRALAIVQSTDQSGYIELVAYVEDDDKKAVTKRSITIRSSLRK